MSGSCLCRMGRGSVANATTSLSNILRPGGPQLLRLSSLLNRLLSPVRPGYLPPAMRSGLKHSPDWRRIATKHALWELRVGSEQEWSTFLRSTPFLVSLFKQALAQQQSAEVHLADKAAT